MFQGASSHYSSQAGHQQLSAGLQQPFDFMPDEPANMRLHTDTPKHRVTQLKIILRVALAPPRTLGQSILGALKIDVFCHNKGET
jgi:hypothetical protein